MTLAKLPPPAPLPRATPRRPDDARSSGSDDANGGVTVNPFLDATEHVVANPFSDEARVRRPAPPVPPRASSVDVRTWRREGSAELDACLAEAFQLRTGPRREERGSIDAVLARARAAAARIADPTAREAAEERCEAFEVAFAGRVIPYDGA
jgi:hypothetical protein